jgi:peptide/bleomycin uptake transporter
MGKFYWLCSGLPCEQLPIGVSRFWSPLSIWFYIWFLVSTAIFAGFWRIISNNPWQRWSFGARHLFYLISGLRSG